ncbi:hypothetical protein ALTERO38_20314 [Alteromonas sp. 38]|nr:hypothetical protein ALTER154_100224 [Alteromonas sp. 154]VXB05543.1 hypothetical protein ALTERO38_20314 [Alteromonas sp. 38]
MITYIFLLGPATKKMQLIKNIKIRSVGVPNTRCNIILLPSLSL